jgi:hypothetical protein
VTFVTNGSGDNQVVIGLNAAETATALFSMLQGAADKNLKKSKPYKNSTAGVVEFAYQQTGYWETIATSDPRAIKVALSQVSPSNPRGGRSPAEQFTATFPAANSMNVGDWVLFQGFKANGVILNRLVAQVTEANGSSFTVGLPFLPIIPNNGSRMVGTFSDGGTATTTSVVIAFNSYARDQQEVSNIQMVSAPGLPLNRHAGVYLYFPRADTGTRVLNTWLENAGYFGYYFAGGGVNVEFDKGWRADGAGIADIYWRVNSAGDTLRIANGTANTSVPGGGASLMLDASNCGDGTMQATLSHVDMESDQFQIAPGMGVITLYDCGGDPFNTQFFLNMDGVQESETPAVHNPGILMSPPNDLALQLTVINSSFNGQTATNRWAGIPALIRSDMAGAQGWVSLLNYDPPLNSIGNSNYGPNVRAYNAPAQFIGDVNISQLWQYGVRASAFLYTDSSFKALPNGTTLFPGQIIAPPALWNGAGGRRFAINVVTQIGTTGVPNGGATLCTSASSGWELVCNSAVDLSAGQAITVGAERTTIKSVNATDSSAVHVKVNSRVGTLSTPTALDFSAPVLGPELQLGTQSASASSFDSTRSEDLSLFKPPTAGGPAENTFLNDDSTRGACSGCCTSGLRTAQSFCTGTAASSATLTLFGAGATSPSCTSIVGPHSTGQLLMNSNGSVSNFAVRCAQSGSSPASGMFTVWDLPSGTTLTGAGSGVDTGLTVTFGTAPANTTVFDSTHTFAYSKGDLLRIEFATQANETLGDCEASFNY